MVSGNWLSRTPSWLLHLLWSPFFSLFFSGKVSTHAQYQRSSACNTKDALLLASSAYCHPQDVKIPELTFKSDWKMHFKTKSWIFGFHFSLFFLLALDKHVLRRLLPLTAISQNKPHPFCFQTHSALTIIIRLIFILESLNDSEYPVMIWTLIIIYSKHSPITLQIYSSHREDLGYFGSI